MALIVINSYITSVQYSVQRATTYMH